jgi:hypothetical protein
MVGPVEQMACCLGLINTIDIFISFLETTDF